VVAADLSLGPRELKVLRRGTEINHDQSDSETEREGEREREFARSIKSEREPGLASSAPDRYSGSLEGERSTLRNSSAKRIDDREREREREKQGSGNTGRRKKLGWDRGIPYDIRRAVRL